MNIHPEEGKMQGRLGPVAAFRANYLAVTLRPPQRLGGMFLERQIPREKQVLQLHSHFC